MKWLGLEGIPGDPVPLSVICMVFHFVVFAHVHCCTCSVHRAKIQPSLWNVSFYLEDCIAWDIGKYHCFKKLTVDIFFCIFQESSSSSSCWWKMERVGSRNGAQLLFSSWRNGAAEPDTCCLPICLLLSYFYFSLMALLALIKSCYFGFLAHSIRQIKTVWNANIPSVYFIRL